MFILFLFETLRPIDYIERYLRIEHKVFSDFLFSSVSSLALWCRLLWTRLKIDQTTDDPDHTVKKATAGLEKIKEEVFGPDKAEQAVIDHRQG